MAVELRDYFLKLDGIPGESQDATHPDEIRLWSFGFGMRNRNRAGYVVSKTAFEDISFEGPIDVSYPKIQGCLGTNQPIKNATLCCRKAGKYQLDFLKINLTGLYVSHCRLESEGHLLKMFFNMSFATMEITYCEQFASGMLGGGISYFFDLRPA